MRSLRVFKIPIPYWGSLGETDAVPHGKKPGERRKEHISLSTSCSKVIPIKYRTSWWWWWWCLVTRSCPSLCSPMDCSLPGSSVCGISQARILEWVAETIGLARIFVWVWTPLASRDVPGERGRLSSCVWNLGFFPNDSRKNCPPPTNKRYSQKAVQTHRTWNPDFHIGFPNQLKHLPIAANRLHKLCYWTQVIKDHSFDSLKISSQFIRRKLNAITILLANYVHKLPLLSQIYKWGTGGTEVLELTQDHTADKGQH